VRVCVCVFENHALAGYVRTLIQKNIFSYFCRRKEEKQQACKHWPTEFSFCWWRSPNKQCCAGWTSAERGCVTE